MPITEPSHHPCTVLQPEHLTTSLTVSALQDEKWLQIDGVGWLEHGRQRAQDNHFATFYLSPHDPFQNLLPTADTLQKFSVRRTGVAIMDFDEPSTADLRA